MGFKRHEGFSGKIPQKFIDNNLVNCPICGSTHPHWSLNMEMKLDIEGNKYLFKCEDCGGILSARVPDVVGINKTALTTTGLIKKFKGKKNRVTYMTIEDVGTQTNMGSYIGVEMSLDDIITLGFNQNRPSVQNNIDDTIGNQEFIFCTNCGAKLKPENKFCSKCGNKVE